MRHQRRLVEARAVAQAQEADDDLAPFLVRRPDDGDFGDVGMLHELEGPEKPRGRQSVPAPSLQPA